MKTEVTGDEPVEVEDMGALAFVDATMAMKHYWIFYLHKKSYRFHTYKCEVCNGDFGQRIPI